MSLKLIFGLAIAIVLNAYTLLFDSFTKLL